MKLSPSFLLTLALLTGIHAADKTGRGGGSKIFLEGPSLGSVAASDPNLPEEQALLPNAKAALASILKKNNLSGNGKDKAAAEFKAAKTKNKIIKDKKTGHKHVRFEQTYEGLEVVDAALVVHIDQDNQVYAINGEVVADGSVETVIQVDCETAFASVLDQPEYAGAVWLTDCGTLKIVIDEFGDAHKAWERTIGYQPAVTDETAQSRPYQMDKLYASVVTGAIVATRPQVLGAAASLSTQDCLQGQSTPACVVISTSPDDIQTADAAANGAHNYARSTYQFFYDNYGRDSLDNQAMTIVSRVHVGVAFNNAFYNASSNTVNYGDGIQYTHFSQAVDVVAHELTHGVTRYSSGLVYISESGSLNEAMSDIFAACVDRQEGASIADTFLCGEDIYTPARAGDATRYMTTPVLGNQPDWFPLRYTGSLNNGGVHINSGIMNLAFALMVQGGTHPRGFSTVVVPAIDADFDVSLLAAAEIFYKANTACLTPLSGFFEARQCTMLHAGPHIASVEAAWAAVGVFAVITDAPLTISAARGGGFVGGIAGIPPGTRVTCATEGNGDADILMVMAGISTGLSFRCVSAKEGSIESCSHGPINTEVSKVWLTVVAYLAFTDVTITCTKVSTATVIVDKVPLPDIIVPIAATSVFILEDVPAATGVACEFEAASGVPSVRGSMMTDDGDIVEYAPCSIPATGFIGSKAACTMMSPTFGTNLYMRITAGSEAISGLTMTCSFLTEAPSQSPSSAPTEACKRIGFSCTRSKQCCKSTATCDGPIRAARKCKFAKPEGGACTRNTQCADGYYCSSNICTKKSN